MIPSKGTKIKREKVITEHPEYKSRVWDYRLYRDCLEAGGGFAPLLKRIKKNVQEDDARAYLEAVEAQEGIVTYLVPHGREHAEDFKDRLQLAYLPNFVKQHGIIPLCGFLTSNKPERTNHPPEFDKWRENATIEGLEYDVWRSDIGMPYGMCYGKLPAIIDSDPHIAETEEERIQMGAEFAKLRVVHPDNIIDWRTGKGGRLVAIKYKAQVDSQKTLLDEHKLTDRYCYVTPEGWFWVDDEKGTGRPSDELTVGDSGVWPWFGKDLPQRSPIVELSFFDGVSLLKDLAPAVVTWFNMLSELRELQRKQIPVFYAPESEAEQQSAATTKAVSTSAYWGVPFDCQVTPGFASPDAVCLNHYMAGIQLIAQWFDDILGTASVFGAQAEAAATLAYRFQITERKLQQMAASVERFELDVAEVVMLWHGKRLSDKITTKSTNSFDAVAVERFLEQLARMFGEIGPFPPIANMLMRKRAFSLVIPEVPEELREDLEKEWELSVEEESNADDMTGDNDNPDAATKPETVPRPGGQVAGNVGGKNA